MSSGLRDSLHVGAQGEGEIIGADPRVSSLVPRGRIVWRGKGCHQAAEGNAGLSMGAIKVAMEVWSLEKRTLLLAQMGKRKEGDGTTSHGHGYHPLGPSME